VLLAAGCGGEEQRLPGELADALAERSEVAAARLESRRFCAADAEAVGLQTRAIEAVNEGLVPAELQEELLGRINALREAVSCEPPRAAEGAVTDARALADWLQESG
jgi:hypothetical protein